MARFEVVLYPGEDDERLPSWDVVELEDVSPTVRIGTRVWSTYNMEEGEQLATEMALLLQREYEEQLYKEYA